MFFSDDAFRRKDNLYKPQILSKRVSRALPLPEKTGRKGTVFWLLEGIL